MPPLLRSPGLLEITSLRKPGGVTGTFDMVLLVLAARREQEQGNAWAAGGITKLQMLLTQDARLRKQLVPPYGAHTHVKLMCA
jgi:hypothetical protein